MADESLSSRQFSFIIALFLFGSSSILGVSKAAKQDSWISFLLGSLISIPFILMYARINTLYPGKNLSSIITSIFGKLISNFINGLMVFYALFLGSLVIRDFSEFIQVMSMPETPQLAIVLLLSVSVFYMAKCGIMVVGKCSTLLLPLIVVLTLFTIAFTAQNIDITNLMPVMGTGIKRIVAGSVDVTAFPFLEAILFLYTFGHLKKGESAYKSYLLGLGIAVLLLLAAILRNITTLGVPMSEISYFPSYVTARLINVGDFLTRMEGVISVNLTICGIIKISVCIVAAANGLSEMFGFKDVNSLIIPAGLIMITLNSVLFENIMELFESLKYYTFFAFPFQIVLPVIIWIGCEIKAHELRKQNASAISAS